MQRRFRSFNFALGTLPSSITLLPRESHEMWTSLSSMRLCFNNLQQMSNQTGVHIPSLFSRIFPQDLYHSQNPYLARIFVPFSDVVLYMAYCERSCSSSSFRNTFLVRNASQYDQGQSDIQQFHKNAICYREFRNIICMDSITWEGGQSYVGVTSESLKDWLGWE